MEKVEQNEKLAQRRYTFKDMDDGQVFLAEYLGSTQIIAPNRIVTEQDRQNQAQLAVKRVKAPYDEKQPKIEVQLFISTQKFKVIDVDDDVIEVKDDETMMMHPLHSISYIADIGDLLVVIAKRHSTDPFEYDSRTTFHEYQEQKLQKFTCHVFQSIRQESQVISNCIGQAFNYAYREFLEMHGLGPDNMSHEQYRHMLDVHEIYHDDLNHYIKKENAKEIWITKFKSEIMGVVLVESGWGSIVPTFILANMKHGGPAEMSTALSIGDQVMAVDGVSLVGLSMPKVQEIFKQLRTQTVVKVNIVNCPPTVTVRIRRPNTSVQLGFSVQAGIICSLMRGGIAEKGGVRVGHKIIEINAHSVVATSHEKIVGLLQNAVGEIIMKTMPAAMFRLLTGVDSPTYM
jgi:amyloid beta (A4) precursor protein-binding family A protein 1 (X11)